MSASLVGSEMCIRDRCRHAQKSLSRSCTSAWAVELRQQLGISTAPQGSVSYTHLTLPTICSV
eukprot:7357960-Alexandrium_andersonii.AAC.1